MTQTCSELHMLDTSWHHQLNDCIILNFIQHPCSAVVVAAVARRCYVMLTKLQTVEVQIPVGLDKHASNGPLLCDVMLSYTVRWRVRVPLGKSFMPPLLARGCSGRICHERHLSKPFYPPRLVCGLIPSPLSRSSLCMRPHSVVIVVLCVWCTRGDVLVLCVCSWCVCARGVCVFVMCVCSCCCIHIYL